MIDRRAFVAGLGAVLAAPRAAGAQKREQIKKLGIFSSATPPELDSSPMPMRLRAAFMEALRNHGWIEGYNLTLERRFAAGQLSSLPDLAADLVAKRPDLIVASSGVAAAAAKAASQDIPIVALADDLVSHGLAASVTRPGGNVTGLNLISPELAAKQLALLREVMPSSSRIAVLACPPTAELNWAWGATEKAARQLKVTLLPFSIQAREEIEGAFKKAEQAGARGLVVFDCALFNSLETAILVQHRLPAIYYIERYAHAGGLMAYGPDTFELVRRAAWYVDRILRGAKPADLPIEQPTKFRLVINLKTAKALGLTIPPSLLLRADQVIE